MGIPVLILGESGSGKTTSLRNFDVDEVGVFNVASKPFPFRKKLNKVNGATYDIIIRTIRAAKLKKYVIDDSQYLMAFEMFSRAKETGYNKFAEIALHFETLVKTVVESTPDDVIVYFLHHTEVLDNGKTKAKTVGKMLDNHLTLEGLFSVVLLAKIVDGRYVFETQSDGFTTTKTPLDMFADREIDNDLKFVDKTIREYWDLDGADGEDRELEKVIDKEEL